MVDLTDQKTFELTLTNLGLGIVVLVCCLAVLRAFLLDLFEKVAAPKTAFSPVQDQPPAKLRPAKPLANPSIVQGAHGVARHVMGFTAAGMPVDPRVEPPRVSR